MARRLLTVPDQIHPLPGNRRDALLGIETMPLTQAIGKPLGQEKAGLPLLFKGRSAIAVVEQKLPLPEIDDLSHDGRGVARIDGKVVYACLARLEPREMHLAPLANKPLVRDLVSEIAPPAERLPAPGGDGDG